MARQSDIVASVSNATSDRRLQNSGARRRIPIRCAVAASAIIVAALAGAFDGFVGDCRASESGPGGLSGATQRPAIVFDLDQGLAFGIIENRDLASLDRILDVVGKFKSKFEVFVLFHPLTAKTRNLHDVLQATAAHGIPFLLDAYTSDAMAVGNVQVKANPDADPSHGVSLPLAKLDLLKQDPAFGAAFAGLRFMEVLSLNYTVNTCREMATGPNRVDWCDTFRKNLPSDTFLEPRRFAEPLLDFATRNGMWVLWSDWKWDAQTAAEQDMLKRLLTSGSYARTLVLAYANNLPREEARASYANWEQWRADYSPLVGKEVRSLGFSDQAWTCDNLMACPVDVLAKWAALALREGAAVIELEPAWYFFELPGAPDPSYPDSPHWRNDGGRPSDRLALFAAALGIDLMDSEPRPRSSSALNEAACMMLEAPTALKPNEPFAARLALRNTGVNSWTDAADELSASGNDRWGASILPLSSKVVKSGEDATFAIALRAPATSGAKRLEFRMQQIGKGPFGQTCSLLVSVQP